MRGAREPQRGRRIRVGLATPWSTEHVLPPELLGPGDKCQPGDDPDDQCDYPEPEKHRGDDPDDPCRGSRAFVLRVAAPCLDRLQLVVGHDPGHYAEDLAADQTDDA